jgi:hypothetical protein
MGAAEAVRDDGSPWMFTVTLSQPRGQREVEDAGLVDPRPVTEVMASPLNLLG